MALKEALIKAVNEFGKDVLIEPRLLNILNDYHGFDEMPSARYVLKAFQKEGYLANIINMSSCNQLKTVHFAQRIHRRYGFDVIIVEHIVDQICIAIDALLLRVTQEDLDNAWIDEFGVKFSLDRKRLLEASNKEIKTYSIPKGTLVICSDAFSYCNSLIHLDIPEGIARIGHGAFEDCSSLQRLVLPKSLTHMGINPFILCSGIKYIISLSPHFFTSNHLILNKDQNHVIGSYGNERHIQIPNGVTDIDEYAFYLNDSALSIVMPDGVKNIGEQAFRHCSALQKLILPDSVMSIGKEAFIECSSLLSISLPENSNYIDFYDCRSLLSIKIPKNISHIIDYAFSNCRNIKSIHFPDNITSIGKKAFYDCCLLKNIEWSDQIKSIGDEAFELCVSLKSIVFPKNLAQIGKESFMRCDSLESIIFNNKVRQIDEDAFKYCESLRAIIIPRGLRSHFEQLFPLEYHKLIIEQL